MSRVATIPLQRSMNIAIQRSQQLLAETQQKLATGKKAPDYASLGTEAVRNLSARSLLAQQDAYKTASAQVSTALSLNDANMGTMETTVNTLKQDLLTAIGTREGAGVTEAIATAFNQFRNALNASSGGVSLFGGAQTDGPPFLPNTLADTIGTPASAAFVNDNVTASVRLSDGVDVEYGVTANAIGTKLYTAFQTLAELGPIIGAPTDAQVALMAKAAGEIDTGLVDLRSVNAENGRKQAQVETLGTRAADRSLLMKSIIERNEDADLGEVAIDLAQQKTILQASYSVFAQLADLSLGNYLR
ncbi:flagellin [Sphingomonas sp. 37zxx]|uniref:flagellin n=1 Tax=Sphingomonas sp. 37zxx TaxID=1550073 RepID=UPI00053BF99F|nr:flagellin [Sphingomonas sp. 37zxx]